MIQPEGLNLINSEYSYEFYVNKIVRFYLLKFLEMKRKLHFFDEEARKCFFI